MKVRIIESPNPEKKFRAILPDGKKVDFGGAGYEDFTIHEDADRMRRYVKRHGGVIKKSIFNITKPKNIIKEMSSISKSKKEDWSIKGIHKAGFWSRWYLWSYPKLKDVKKLFKNKFGIKLYT